MQSRPHRLKLLKFYSCQLIATQVNSCQRIAWKRERMFNFIKCLHVPSARGRDRQPMRDSPICSHDSLIIVVRCSKQKEVFAQADNALFQKPLYTQRCTLVFTSLNCGKNMQDMVIKGTLIDHEDAWVSITFTKTQEASQSSAKTHEPQQFAHFCNMA